MIRAWIVVALLVVARPAWAHDARPGVLALAERDAGVFDLRVIAPVDRLGDAVELTLVLPGGCARLATQIRCAGELAGTLAIRGMRGDTMRTIVVVERRDGRRDEWIVRASAPTIDLGAPPPGTWRAWVRVGVEHILGGLDHLAFVIGLLLVLGARVHRRLLATLTAFTLAHSLTLALAVLGVVDVAIAPVEACIAASVVLVAREATHRQPTAIRRWPWLAAALFGLIHGLGFASALGTLGLPRASLASSLLWFNVGVELGQLAVVGAVVGVVALGRRALPSLAPATHRLACTALGGAGFAWLLTRVV